MVKNIYFWRSLWRALQLTSVKARFSVLTFGFTENQTHRETRRPIDIFVWRLDCRLKDIYYLLVINFVIFVYFWGKIHLFLRSLWRALQTDVEYQCYHRVLFCGFITTDKTALITPREVCVTVGLSSEVWLLPTSNKICDFWLFFG